MWELKTTPKTLVLEKNILLPDIGYKTEPWPRYNGENRAKRKWPIFVSPDDFGLRSSPVILKKKSEEIATSAVKRAIRQCHGGACCETNYARKRLRLDNTKCRHARAVEILSH